MEETSNASEVACQKMDLLQNGLRESRTVPPGKQTSCGVVAYDFAIRLVTPPFDSSTVEDCRIVCMDIELGGNFAWVVDPP